MVALFYRATLLHFAELSAEVSKVLYLDQQDNKLSVENIKRANDLRAEFLHFANYWYFNELANKDEEMEHFLLQCREYSTDIMKRDIEEEVDKLNASLHNYFQFRNTEAVNRLAMLSLILGAGAVITGFFGMNFAREFGKYFFEGDARGLWFHYAAVWGVTLVTFGALLFGAYVVIANWNDYREILAPRKPENNLRPKE
jgi:Mg2+ and Co2+ transporter CorA